MGRKAAGLPRSTGTERREESARDSCDPRPTNRASNRQSRIDSVSRRRFVEATAGSVLLSGVASAQESTDNTAGAGSGAYWPNVAGPGCRSFTKPKRGLGGKPTLEWRVDLSDTATPVYAGGTVFGALDDGRIVAVDVKTGGKVELFQFPSDTSGIVYRDGTVYAVDYENTVAAIGEETGAVRWRRTLSTRGTNLTVDDEHLYVGTADSRVVILDRTSGRIESRLDPFDEGFDSPTWLVRDGSTLYAGVESEGAFAWNLSEGSLAWKQTRATGFPALAGGTLYTRDVESGATHGIEAVDASTGALRWSQQVNVGGGILNGFVVGPERIYVGGDEKIAAVDRRAGETAWPSGLGSDRMIGTPTTVCIVLGERGELVGVDPATGLERWRFGFDSSANEITIPAATENGIVIGYEDNLYLFTRK